MTESAPPPEAELIERLRKALSPRLSVSRAAKAAGISEGRWRQIAKGYQQATPDLRLPVRAPADTLARMARVVGATPDQLEQVGRDDAAAVLNNNPTAREELLLSELDIDVLLAEIRRRVLNPSISRAPSRGESLLDVMDGKQAQDRGSAG